MKKLIPTALIAVLLLFIAYAGYRYYMEEVKPIQDIKNDMAEQRKIYDSIRPDAMPLDFSIEPETAPPLPKSSFSSLEDLNKAEIEDTQPQTETIPEIGDISDEFNEIEEISPEINQSPDFQEIPPMEEISSIPEDSPAPLPNPEPIPETVPPETIPPTQSTEAPENTPLQGVKAFNPQAIAWLTIPDTDLDYPIAQAEDNDFYLWRGFNGLLNGTGTPFLDYRCQPDFSGYNSIIYGHNMVQMLMFATIRLYADKAYMEAHPEGWLLLDDGLHKIQFFAFLSVQSDSAVYHTDFVNQREFEEYKELLFDCAVYTMNVPEELDHIILLSTCTFERENQRGIVVGKLT
ncbi:MAG: sortase [Oscillospiraceae bacterium]